MSPIVSADRPRLIRKQRILKKLDTEDFDDAKSHLSGISTMKVEILNTSFTYSQTMEPINPDRLDKKSLDELKE